MVNEIIFGTVLSGSLILFILLYTTSLILLLVKAKNGGLASDSRGIKNLKYQEYNHAWNKFVFPLL